MSTVRLPVPAPLDPMAKTTDDAAALDRQRERSDQIIREREQAAERAIATRDAEAQRQQEREQEDRDARAGNAIAERISNAARARMATWGVASFGAVVAGFALGGPVGGVVALAAAYGATRVL